MTGPSGNKTLLKLIIDKTNATDVSIQQLNTDLSSHIKTNDSTLRNIELRLETLNAQMALITGEDKL